MRKNSTPSFLQPHYDTCDSCSLRQKVKKKEKKLGTTDSTPHRHFPSSATRCYGTRMRIYPRVAVLSAAFLPRFPLSRLLSSSFRSSRLWKTVALNQYHRGSRVVYTSVYYSRQLGTSLCPHGDIDPVVVCSLTDKGRIFPINGRRASCAASSAVIEHAAST